MSKNITLWGASYSDVPAILLPQTGGGTAKFIDETDVVTYYTGSATPSSSQGQNGDIYLKVGS